jgi:hypothetical protein
MSGTPIVIKRISNNISCKEFDIRKRKSCHEMRDLLHRNLRKEDDKEAVFSTSASDAELGDRDSSQSAGGTTAEGGCSFHQPGH